MLRNFMISAKLVNSICQPKHSASPPPLEISFFLLLLALERCANLIKARENDSQFVGVKDKMNKFDIKI